MRAPKLGMFLIIALALMLLRPTSSFVFVTTNGKNHGSLTLRLPMPCCRVSSPRFLSATDGSEEEDEETAESLQQKLTYISALEERNKSQLESFIDEADQWESMEQWERDLLLSKDEIEKRLDDLFKQQ